MPTRLCVIVCTADYSHGHCLMPNIPFLPDEESPQFAVHMTHLFMCICRPWIVLLTNMKDLNYLSPAKPQLAGAEGGLKHQSFVGPWQHCHDPKESSGVSGIAGESWKLDLNETPQILMLGALLFN